MDIIQQLNRWRLDIRASARELDLNTVEVLRKRHFFFLCVAVALPIIITFGVIDFLEQDWAELVMDIVLFSTLCLGVFVIWLGWSTMLVYRIGLLVVSAVLLYSVAIASGLESILYWIFALPILFVFFLEQREGILWSLLFWLLLALIFFAPLPFSDHTYGASTAGRFLAALLFVIIIAFGLESSRRYFSQALADRNAEVEEERRRLEIALAEVQVLSGLLPICANCHKIRNDKGYWQDVAVYLNEHTGVDFSHGICPDCMVKLYPSIQTGPKDTE